MDSRNHLVMSQRRLSLEGRSSNIPISLRNRIRGDRAENANHLCPLPSATTSTNETFVSSPVESPFKSLAAPSLPCALPKSPLQGVPVENSSSQSSVPPSLRSTNPHQRLLALRQMPLVFAVDVSGSTEDWILEQEQNAILAIASTADRGGITAGTTILPWSHETYSPVTLTDVPSLSAGGGTEPAVLLDDAVYRRHLQDSNLWFLLTDGLIDEAQVHKFANAIPKAGLHGAACVIILFGYLTESPFDCNVSVGMSVFAVSPHCIFLFHDVQTGIVYVFQAKGNFSSLLPCTKQFTPFGTSTRWTDLVRITYRDLAEVKLPPATKLAQDIILLPGGRRFNMNDIYNNTLPEAEMLYLFSDLSALDVIVLAAKTRAKEAEVKTWISKARLSTKYGTPTLFLRREDIGGLGKVCLLELINEIIRTGIIADQPDLIWRILRASTSSLKFMSLRSNLCYHHYLNWQKFERCIATDGDPTSKMNEVLDGVLSTIQVCGGSVLPSPAMLTPVTSLYGSTLTPSTNLSHRSRRGYPLELNQKLATETSTVAQELLFLAGYKGSRTFTGNVGERPSNYSTCALCGRKNSIQTLLLQTSSQEEHTQHFPQADSRTRHKYPLALGNYPETDVVLPLTACDACAFILVGEEGLPFGKRVDAALPLVSLADEGNLKQLLQTLHKIYEHRFYEETILLIFLSTLCATIEELIRNSEPASSSLLKALEWCCKALCKLTPIGNPVSAVLADPTPLETTLVTAFPQRGAALLEFPVLSYPFEGFLVIVRLAGLIGEIDAISIELFVWKRLLYELTKQHVELRKRLGTSRANTKLKTIVLDEHSASETAAVADEQSSGPAPGSSPSQVLSLSVADLSDTYLLSSSPDFVSQFQRLGDVFAPIENSTDYHAALAVFLHTLLNVSLANENEDLDVEKLFRRVRCRTDRIQQARKDLYDVFDDPTLVDANRATALVQEAYRLHGVEDGGWLILDGPRLEEPNFLIDGI